MKIEIQSKSFREAFAVAGAYAPTRTTREVYKSVKLAVSPGNVASLTAHNPDEGVAIRRPLDGVECLSPGVVLLSPGVVGKFLAAVGDEPVSLSLADGKLTLKARSSRVVVATADPDTFADPSLTAAGKSLALSGPDLRAAIRRTIWAADPLSTSFALGGPCFRWTADRLILTATDGRRMAEADIPIESNAPHADWSFVVPAAALKQIDATFRSGDEVLTITFGQSEVVFASDRGVVVPARMLHGRFPNIDNLRPDGSLGKTAPIDPATFLPVLKQVAVVDDSEAGSNAVTLGLSDGVMRLRSAATAIGSSEAEYPIGWSAAPAEISVNGAWLDQAIRASGDEPFTLDLATCSRFEGRSPDLFVESPGFRCTLCPLNKG